MSTLSELFPKARKLAHDLQAQIRAVELGHVSSDNVFMGLGELQRQISILEGLIIHERPQQRDQWRRKIAELGNEAEFLRGVLDRYVRSRTKEQREAQEREELLARRNSAMPAIVVDQLMEEGASLQRSSAVMNDILMSGQATLASLVDQRGMLKGAHRKVLDIINFLGVSDRLMRSAERRSTTDKYIVLGGMAITLVVLYMCWRAVV